jgi:hypothetical protein
MNILARKKRISISDIEQHRIDVCRNR